MTELARGTVFDRPWGRTLGALGMRGLSGQLTLTSFDGKRCEIAFSNGAVIGASSPIASDAAVRVALTGGLISTTQVAELARKQAAQADRDEIEVISDHLRLGFDQAMRLRRRTIAQRASRTFSIDKGEFVVTDQITVPTVAGSELDIRSIIYLGAKQNLSESRLASELGLFGTWFRLKPEAFEDLAQFGFTDQERPIIDQLMNGASLGELEGIVGIDGRTVRATLYALCAMNACNVEQTRGQTTKPPPATLSGKRSSGSSPPTSQPAAAPPTPTPPPAPAPPPTPRSEATTVSGTPRAQRPTAQPLVAYRPGMRRSGGSAPPPNTTQTPVDVNRPMGAAGNTMPPPNARRATTTPPAGTEIVEGGARFPRARSEPGTTRSGDATSPGFNRARSEPGTTRTGTGSNPPLTARTTTTAPRTTTPPPSRTTTAPPTARTTTAPATARTTTPPPAVMVSRTPTPPPRSPTVPPRTTAPTSLPKTRMASATKLPGLQAPEVLAIVAERAKQMDHGADHYGLLGVAPTATGDDIRKTYFNLARALHPDRLAALGIADELHVAHKVFAQLNTAFSILSDNKRRAEYDNLLGRGGEAAIAAEQAKADEQMQRIFASEEAYKKGELALKREDLPTAIAELANALELNPNEPDFLALHAWAVFCAASDKNSVARQTRATLEKAVQRSPKAINPRFYLGRMHRMLGNDKEAMDMFRDVLLDKPHHFEAQAEIRAIEARLQGPKKKR